MRLLLILLLLGALSCQKPSSQSNTPKTILAIFAHPDDETTMSPLLAQYGKEHEVYLLIATDGRNGVTDHAGIPAGDSLIAVRRQELICACEKLGIHPHPIHLDLLDGMGFQNGMGAYFGQMFDLRDQLTAQIKRIKPDIVITFGPDGDSGHPDHRLVGAITTEAIMREGLQNDLSLYYFSWSEEQAKLYEGWNLSYADRSALDTRVRYSEEEEDIS
ncbi:MAG: PIG-L deacetylase family protein, partial [Bacteroidia bacterium]